MSTLIEDFDAPDEEERQIAARRTFMYSTRALKVGAAIQKTLVRHTDFADTIQACDRIFQLGRELNLQQGAVIVGGTGVGKSALIRYFRDSLPNSSLFERGLGVLSFRCPTRPNVGHVMTALLHQLKHPFSRISGPVMGVKREMLLQGLRQKGTRLLFVDEAQHLLVQTRYRARDVEGSTVTDLLRELMDEVPLGLCLCGTEALLQLDAVDDHLAGRLSGRLRLRNFDVGPTWIAFLTAFAKSDKGIDLSILRSAEEATRLHHATGGNPRAFKRLITEATLVAVDDGHSAVKLEHLKTASQRVHGGAVPPGSPYAN